MNKLNLVLMLAVGVCVFAGCKMIPEISPAKMQEESARVQPQLQVLGKAVADQELTGDQLADWIALLQAGNAASAPFNPYALPVGAGLTLLSAVLGVVVKQKSKETAKSQAKYQAHKQGVELSMKELSLENSEQAIRIDKVIYDNIGLARQRNGV